jgi:cytoskeleton protein RodZ
MENGANLISRLRSDRDIINGKGEYRTVEKTPEPPQEADQDLKAIREARGLSPEDIFKATRVSMINLMAVENGDFDRLPPPVYARNFIRKYARAVGIDEKPLLSRYEKHLESLTPPREETEIRKPWPENGRRYRFLFVSLGLVILAGILVYALFLLDQSGGKASAPSSEAPSPAAQAGPSPAPATQPPPAAAPAVPPRPAPTTGKTESSPAPAAAMGSPATAGSAVQPPPAAAPGAKTYTLAIEARELTWIRITEDRKSPYQALLKPGDKIERTASEYFLLDIGNAAGIDLIFQGKSLGSLGKQGQTLHMRLPEKVTEKKTP